MTPDRLSPSTYWRLQVLVGVAFFLRIMAVTWLLTPERLNTTYEHGVIAENILSGRGFSVWFLGDEGPTSQQAPWVPLVLASFYAAFGVASPAALIGYQTLQACIGASLIALVVRLGWSLVPDRPAVGWIAGIFAALYPPHIYMVTHVQAAVWSSYAVAWLMLTVCEPPRPALLPRSIRAGLITGWMLLIDPILALVAVPAFIKLFIDAGRDGDAASHRVPWPRLRGHETTTLRTWPRQAWPWHPLKSAAIASCCTLLIVAPWCVRNFAVHGEPVFIKSTFGYAFWQGNNPLSLGTDKVPKAEAAAIAADHDGSLADRHRALWEARHETIYIDDLLLKPTGYRDLVGLSEPAKSRLLGDRAWAFIAAHPDDYAALCLRRLRYFLLWDETNPKASHVIYRASSLVWLIGAVAGLMFARRRWSALWPTVAAFSLVAMFHVLTITSARFRLPIESFGFLWAAVGLVGVLDALVCHGHARVAMFARRSHASVDHGTRL